MENNITVEIQKEKEQETINKILPLLNGFNINQIESILSSVLEAVSYMPITQSL
jgi:hypothetical protein